jgi:hypothetical protein
MGELVHDPVRRIEVPKGRHLSPDEFRQLTEQLVTLRQELVSVHELFALLIKTEEKKNRFRIAFLEQGCEIPEVIVTFTCQLCQIVNSPDGVRVSVETVDVSAGLSRLADLIRLMGQKAAFLHCQNVDTFMAALQIRVTG